MYNFKEGECQEAKTGGFIPEDLNHLQEGRLRTDDGHEYRGVTIFNVPIGEDEYVAHVL